MKKLFIIIAIALTLIPSVYAADKMFVIRAPEMKPPGSFVSFFVDAHNGHSEVTVPCILHTDNKVESMSCDWSHAKYFMGISPNRKVN